MAYFLYSRHFNNQEEMEVSVNEFFALKNKNWYRCWIQKPVERYLNWAYNPDLAL